MSNVDYFAYGSNLATTRMRQRCPSSMIIGVGYVRRRALRFHKIGTDGTGKADAFATGNHDDILWGVIYRIALAEKSVLDDCESLGTGYEEAAISVQVSRQTCPAFLYQALATRIDATLRPANWYYNHVIEGAREHGLPAAHQKRISEYDPSAIQLSHELRS